MNAQNHWDRIYRSKDPEQLSWTQQVPGTSLAFIESFHLSPDARIIDIGGGESRLADCLLEMGYRHITVLDISQEALHRAQQRLGEKAAMVEWIVADIAEFEPEHPYDLWHDRATFHFLTTSPQVTRYLSNARAALPAGGYLVIGTFSDNGPGKCSGLPVHQYNEAELTRQLNDGFDKIRCITEDHRTPFDTLQNFLFCSFKRA
jgi:2-polyprenyl-3-methyl-5-hydroxy-6-metoxy-1,4-benzoquinol methylase